MDILPRFSAVLFDVVGAAIDAEFYRFVPIAAEGVLSHPLSLSHTLWDHLGCKIPPTLSGCVCDGEFRDSAWVRARIPSVFDYHPPVAPRSDPKPSLNNFVFLAIPLTELAAPKVGYVFTTTDTHELCVALAFYEPSPSQEIQSHVSNDFWSLLLSDPLNCSEFEEFVLVGTDIDRSPCRVTWKNFKLEIEQIAEAIG